MSYQILEFLSFLHLKELLKLKLRLCGVTWLKIDGKLIKHALLFVAVTELAFFISVELDSQFWDSGKEEVHFFKNFGYLWPISSLKLGM